MSNDVFTGTGLDDVLDQTRESSKVDLKEAFIRLKTNESIKVRILSPKHLVVYKAHGSFDKGIYTTVCKSSTGVLCPMCEASKLNKDWNKALYAKTRVAFAFADLASGEVKIFDATKNQAHIIASAIKEYEEDLDSLAFTFKRTGKGSSTAYTLSPIIKLKGADLEAFNKFNDYELEDTFFADRIAPKADKYMLANLKKAGFPIEELADRFNIEEVETDEQTTPDVKELPKGNFDIVEDDLPF